MIVVSDTSPLNYLVLIREEHILPKLFGRVITTPAIIGELRRRRTPAPVRRWASHLPDWLELQAPNSPWVEHRLGPGEQEAIALATELKADLVLIDDRDAVAAARRLDLLVTGTLGVIEMAAERRLLVLADAIAALQKTTFRGSTQLFREMLERDSRRSESDP